MSKKDKLIKSKSIYTLRSKHTSLLDGTIYENDHVTIIKNDGVWDEDRPLFSESNFKFRIGLGNGSRRRHSRGGWVDIDGTNNNVWTLNNLPISQITDDSKIVIKPNYSSLKDFAYYGSAVELIKATLNDVIRRYPGGISYYKTAPTVLLDGTTYYKVSNEFNIDFWTPVGVSPDELENPMRVLGASYMNYEDNCGNDIGLNICITGNCLNSIIGKVSFTPSTPVFDCGRMEELRELGEKSGLRTPPAWTYVDVYCYSGVSSTNYLPNVTIPNVDVTLSVKNDKNQVYNYESILSNANGRARFYKDEIPFGGFIGVFDAVGILSGIPFTNHLEVSTDFTQPVLNLYIHFKETQPPLNHFPFSVLVKDCNTNQPLVNADVVFYAWVTLAEGVDNPAANANKPYFTSVIHTNQFGIAELGSGYTSWHYGTNGEDYSHLFIQSNWYIVNQWYAKASYDGSESVQSDVHDGSVTTDVICIALDHYICPFSRLIVQGIAGTSTSVGPGCRSSFTLYNENNDEVVITGYTDNSGKFILTKEEFESNPNYEGFMPVSYNCSMTYNGTTNYGNKEYFINSVTPIDYSQILWFKEQNQTVSKRLIATAYTVSNNIRTGISGIGVSFTAKTDKSGFIYTITKETNQYGVAVANIPNDDWYLSEGATISEMSDINLWSAYTFYNGEGKFGEGTPNRLKSNDNTDIILFTEAPHWEELRVEVTDQNNHRLKNAYVTVCATTHSMPFEYYSNGLTDDEGFIHFYPNSNWRHFNGTQTGSVSNFTKWGCVATYQGRSADAYPIDVYWFYTALTITLPEPITPPQPYVDDCNSISVPEGFYIFLDGEGNKHLLTTRVGQNASAGTVVIRPKSAYTQEFWSTLDDFEKVLLNRATKPIYKAKLESPYIENHEHFYTYKNFVWPTVDTAGTPDLTSGTFQGYLQSLLEIASYYDEYDSDNLWRMMTHESIKNLDWTFSRDSGNDDVEMEDIDYTRMQAMLRTEARIFDDIKRYADNIKTMNTISYDEKNNAPDYFLSDIIELNGFEAKNISRFSGSVSDVIYSSTTISGRTDAEVNSDFMRRLVLSSEYLMSEKGTRRGIEGILGMFGYIYGVDYDIREYVAVAENFPDYDDVVYLRGLGINEYLNAEGVTNRLYGYPVVPVFPAEENTGLYIIPWVDDNENYINGLYFQEKGGWQRIDKKDINLSITLATEISGVDEFNLYGETAPYMTYVSNLEELTSLSNTVIYENMVCYVTDISQMYTIYSSETDYNIAIPIPGEGEEEQGQIEGDRAAQTDQPQINVYPDPNRNYSHYFVLKNTMLSSYVGFVRNDMYNCYGWKNVLKSEFENGQQTVDGLRVLYLESLELSCKGNNPHCGYGKYDDGASYISKLDNIFSYALASGEYEYLKDGDEEDQQDYQDMLATNFGIRNLCIDNKKCHYFLDDSTVVYEEPDRTNTNSQSNIQVNSYYTSELHYMETENGPEGDVEIDDGGYSGYTESGEGYIFQHPEHLGEPEHSYEEGAANSVVNIKNLLITFNTNNNSYFKKYLQNIVFTYLNEMIPSTTILRYKFNDGTASGHNIVPNDYVEDEERSYSITGDTAMVGEEDTLLIENNEGLINNENNS
jgi:hypothetical protein